MLFTKKNIIFHLYYTSSNSLLLTRNIESLRTTVYHVYYIYIHDTRMSEMIHFVQLSDLAQPENVELIITRPLRLLL